MLEVYAREGRHVSSSTAAPNNAPKEFAEDHRCAFRGKRGKVAMKAAMERLFEAGRIANHEEGPPSRRRAWLVLLPSNPPSNPLATLPTPLATHSPYTPSVRVPACESGHARANGGGADEASSPVGDVWAGEEL